jgi:ureidoacrylate peracid hydrolase
MSEQKEMPDHGRTFTSAEAHGGEKVDAATTALVLIEFQNEFATEGGKLFDAVKGVMADNSMLAKTEALVKQARERGCKIIWTPINFSKDMSDNPNKNLGILKGCNDDALFIRDTWNSELCDELKPARDSSDLEVVGKRGLDAFPGTNLEALLVEHGIKTVAIGGFLTNCCVESTMRTAFEKGFNVITLKECTACTSAEGQKAAVDGTFGMFSTPMNNEDFLGAL